MSRGFKYKLRGYLAYRNRLMKKNQASKLLYLNYQSFPRETNGIAQQTMGKKINFNMKKIFCLYVSVISSVKE